MSLTAGTGPLAPDPAGGFVPPVAAGTVYVEPYPRRVRGELDGRTVVRSDRALLVHAPGHAPVYAFPVDDVDGELGHPQPYAPGHVSIAWPDLDAWFEEEQQIRGHPRNPYHRVDCLPSRRRLHVAVGEVALVDTTAVTMVFETGLAPRAYVPRSAVRMEMLRPSTTTWFCPYKGEAVYFSAIVGDILVEDVAWSYQDTFPEASAIKDYLCFDGGRVTVTGDLPSERRWRS